MKTFTLTSVPEPKAWYAHTHFKKQIPMLLGNFEENLINFGLISLVRIVTKNLNEKILYYNTSGIIALL